MPSPSERVPLRDGPTVAVEALLLVTDLTDVCRPGGLLTLTLGPAGAVTVEPVEALSEIEWTRLVTHKADVHAMLVYRDRDDLDLHLRLPEEAAMPRARSTPQPAPIPREPESGSRIEPETPPALVPVPAAAAPVDLGTLRATSAADLVRGASELARELAAVIDQQKLFVTLNGRRHVKVEGWTTLGAMLGVTPHEVSVTEQDGVYTATVELRRLADGRAVARASAECGAPDEVDRQGRPLWADRPAYARRSMSVTRATSKACRLAFSWIITLGGYEATPAEELPAREDRAEDRALAGARPVGARRAASSDTPRTRFWHTVHAQHYDPDTVRDVLLTECGTTSTKQLTQEEADSVLSVLAARAATETEQPF